MHTTIETAEFLTADETADILYAFQQLEAADATEALDAATSFASTLEDIDADDAADFGDTVRELSDAVEFATRYAVHEMGAWFFTVEDEAAIERAVDVVVAEAARLLRCYQVSTAA